MEALLAKLKKNTTTELWIMLRDYQNRQWLDIREHFFSPDEMKWLPTKRGVMVPAQNIEETIQGLRLLATAQTVGIVKKVGRSAKSEIQIGYREYRGNFFGEVRLYYQGTDNEEFLPSPKGVTFKLDLAPMMVEAMQAAERLLKDATISS